MGIVDDLAELFDAEVLVQPGNLDGFGTFTASGSAVALPARYEEGPRLVRDVTGQEVTSSVLIIVGGVLPSHDPSKLRFTLPSATFLPFDKLQAIRIDPVSDETGVIAAEVSMP